MTNYTESIKEKDIATSSAFVQQRDKILPSAFEFLLHEFNESFKQYKTYKGYRLLAVDGSDLNISHNPNDSNTYFQSVPDTKGFNLLHLNAMYDLCNKLYLDACVQPGRKENEYKALTDMVDRSNLDKNIYREILWELIPNFYQTIVLGDKGYTGDRIAKELKSEKGMTLLALKRSNSKTPYPKDLRNWISKHRRRIETSFSQLTEQFHINEVLANLLSGLKARLQILGHNISYFVNKCLGNKSTGQIKHLIFG